MVKSKVAKESGKTNGADQPYHINDNKPVIVTQLIAQNLILETQKLWN